MLAHKPRMVINESVVSAELDDEVVLLNVETGIYFGLDTLGARIWALLAAGVDREGICTALLAEYEVGRAQLEADLGDYLDTLVSKGLIRTDDE
jgi:hypothetical protein